MKLWGGWESETRGEGFRWGRAFMWVMKAMVCLVAVFVWSSNLLAQGETKGAEPRVELKNPIEFQFRGGSLAEFLKAVKERFALDLEQVGTVPETMLYSVRVPKMRLKGSVRPPRGEERSAMTNGIHFSKVLDLYNQASKDGESGLGRWIIRANDDGDPSLIMLVPPQASSGSSFSVRAFSFPVKSAPQADNLRKINQLIAVERDRLLQVVSEGRQPGLTLADIQGEVNHHSEAGIIVVTGGKVFVEMASAIIEAGKGRPDISEIPIPKQPEKKSE